MSRPLFFAVIVSFLSLAYQMQASAGTDYRPGTCMYNWLRRAGISSKKVIQYDKSLRAAAITEKMLKSKGLPVFTIGFIMHGDMKSANALKNCITGKIKRCRSFNPCQRGGVCNFSFARRIHTCTCRKGLDGDYCEKDCNECSRVREGSSKCKGVRPNCHSNASCINTHGSFQCKCNKGFTGNGVSCINIDECTLKPRLCSRHAKCADTSGSYLCTCLAGYQGNGRVCRPINFCRSSPCQNGGVCKPSVNLYTCHCPVGYEGTHCEKRWLQTDIHKPLPEALRNVTKAMQELSEEAKQMRTELQKQKAEIQKQQKEVKSQKAEI